MLGEHADDASWSRLNATRAGAVRPACPADPDSVKRSTRLLRIAFVQRCADAPGRVRTVLLPADKAGGGGGGGGWGRTGTVSLNRAPVPARDSVRLQRRGSHAIVKSIRGGLASRWLCQVFGGEQNHCLSDVGLHSGARLQGAAGGAGAGDDSDRCSSKSTAVPYQDARI